MDIRLKGLATAPDEYESENGQLSASLNLLNEDGAVRPVRQPQAVAMLPTVLEVLCLHQVNRRGAATAHYVCYNTESGTLGYFTAGGTTRGVVLREEDRRGSAVVVTAIDAELALGTGKLPMVTAIGNMLAVGDKTRTQYLLWRDDAYVNLGDRVPEILMRVELYRGLNNECDVVRQVANPVTGVDFSISGDTEDPMVTKQLTDAVFGAVNYAVAENHRKGRFVFPFFLRLAYRLSDGSYAGHTSPILCDPGREWNQQNHGRYIHATINGDKVTATASGALVRIIWGAGFSEALDQWSDLIETIDVFASAPIYDYDANQSIGHWGGVENVIQCHEPDYTQVANFHKVATVRKADIVQYSGMNLDIPEGTLIDLVARERLPEDLRHSHDAFTGGCVYAFNSRLMLGNVKRRLFEGYHPLGSSARYADGDQHIFLTSLTTHVLIETTDRSVWVRRARPGITDNRLSAVRATVNGEQVLRFTSPAYYYYPDANAKSMVLGCVVSDSTTFAVKINLKPHDFLNGAYALFHTGDTVGIYTGAMPAVDADPTVSEPSMVAVSSVGMPMLMEQYVTVGSGRVQGLATAATALSQGQFGQFPLYAFTTDGVWSLECTSEGKYSSRQPITRDVCINPQGIAQIDQSVLFATDRGLMELSGSQARPLTEDIDSRHPFDVTALPGLGTLHEMLGHGADSCFPLVPLKDYLREGGVVYDYKGQRLVVFNPTNTYAYVYSLRTRLWGMMQSKIKKAVPSYPNALAIVDAGTGKAMVDMSMDGDAGFLAYDYFGTGHTGYRSADNYTYIPKGVLVTRAIKLGESGGLATVRGVVARGVFERGHVQTVLYGSNDLKRWHLVRSSVTERLTGMSGTPYRYFRVALLTQLEPGESIDTLSIDARARLAGTFR